MNKITQDQKQKLHDMTNAELDKLGLTKEEFQALVESKDWAKVVEGHRAFIQSIRSIVEMGRFEFTLQVNYDQSLEDARKDGHYEWESSEITSRNLPSTRKGTADIVMRIVHFNCDISSEDAIAEIDKMGLRPAETHELLALGATQPELQRRFMIVALGSVLQDGRGHRYIPCLDLYYTERNLQLHRSDFRWISCSFATVPK